MSVVGETVWLVAVTEESAEPDSQNEALTGHHLYASAEGAAVSFGDYELRGDAAEIMATQRTRQRW
jgi:hypothetical protein